MRGKNPWVWGIAALVLGLLPFDQLRLLGVAPVLYLMFFVRPLEQRSRTPRRSSCSRCASPHSPGQNYCTKCGWDLSKEYTPDGGDTVLASEMHQPQSSSTATIERPNESHADPPAVQVPTHAEAKVEPPLDVAPETASEQEVVPGEAAVQTPDERGPEVPEEVAPEPEAEPEPVPPSRPWGIPQPGPAPTAEAMTARGATLLSEGRLQEAIDQFTKAIALDPRHREAFERRAEAYTKQGRGERAEEDYRQIQALNAGS